MKINTILFGELVLLTECTLVGSSESLGFQTFVQTSHNGTEKRKALRETAAQVFTINTLSLGKDIAQHFNVLRGGLRHKWAVPVDVELQSIHAVSGDFVPCRTDIYDFRVDSLAVVKHGRNHTVVEIKEVRSDGLKLYNSINLPGAKICPLRVGFILGDVSAAANRTHHQSSIQFQVLDAPLISSVAPSQFLGHDIYFKKLLLEGDSLSVTFTQHQTVVDFGLGPIDQHTNHAFARYGKPMRSVMKSQQELYEYRQFLFRRLGKFRSFWLPTFERNFHLKSSGVVGTTLDVEKCAYLDFALDRKHIAIKDKLGNWSAHRISNAVETAQTLRLTITPALNKPALNIEMISYLGLHRLNSDSIDLEYQGAHITESSVAILEIQP